jgi:small-conductance mechanosensitive channel
MLLLFTGASEEALAQETEAIAQAGGDASPDARQTPPRPRASKDGEPGSERAEQVARETQAEAQKTLQGLTEGILETLPKLLVALATLVVTWLLGRSIRALLYAVLGRWARASAIAALVVIALWMLGAGIAVSVVAGDIRALLGSVGLVGLGLSWALQTPIESFTGWLLNSLRGYYRVGDRIEVGDIFGDVHRIDFLTTTVWEVGRLDRASAVPAGQHTGRLITFPNSEVLTGSILNISQDLPYIWDDLTVAITNESDLRYALEVIRRLATEVVGGTMSEPAGQYEARLRAAGLDTTVAATPEVYVSLAESWVNISIRYLVHARQRRRWRSELTERLLLELVRPEHAGRIRTALPRQEVQLIGAGGQPEDAAPRSLAGPQVP